MITLTKYGAKYNRFILHLEGLSTDTKPTVRFIEYDDNGIKIGDSPIQNGSIYTEIDTGDTYMYDVDNTTWHKVSIGGGGTSGGIILVGETTTALTDEATTNPIMVDGQSYTAQPNDAVIYQSKEFLFDGTKWHEFGDLTGLASKDIGAMTGYAKASSASAIGTSDTLNQAIGKLEKGLDGKQDALSQTQLDAVNSGIDSTKVNQIETNKTNILSEQAKTTGMTEGGSNYITVNGIRVYFSSTAPTGNIPDGSVGVGW